MSLDYAFGSALIFASLVSPLSGSTTGTILLLAGLMEIIAPSIARWKWSVWPAVGVQAHAITDLFAAGSLVVVGSVLIANEGASAAWPMWAGSIMAGLVWLTRWESLPDANPRRSAERD